MCKVAKGGLTDSFFWSILQVGEESIFLLLHLEVATMKKNTRRICVLLLLVVVIACLSVNALAASYPYSALFDNRYYAEGYGVLTATKVSASTSVIDIEDDVYLTNVYRHARVEYKYYPTDTEAGLTSGSAYRDIDYGVNCTALVLADEDSGIYTFRFAKFTFRATVPAVSGGSHNWIGGSDVWKEYDPNNP